MQKILMMIFLFFTPMSNLQTRAINNNKQLALSSAKHFFNIREQKLVLDGYFSDTDPDYGRSCKIYADFSQVGHEYLTVVGEYTPFGNIGDGIYFNEDEITFEQVEVKGDSLSLQQQLSDSFSTGMKTLVILSKKNNRLEFTLVQSNRFLFFTQTIEKKCIIDDYNIS